MAGKKKQERIDPSWPKLEDPKDAVSEFLADRQGSPSPFGDTTFPLPEGSFAYEHPSTVINK